MQDATTVSSIIVIFIACCLTTVAAGTVWLMNEKWCATLIDAICSFWT